LSKRREYKGEDVGSYSVESIERWAIAPLDHLVKPLGITLKKEV